MIDATFVKAIVDTAEPFLAKSENGREYSSRQMFNLPPPTEPAFPGIDLYSLDSLVEYINANRDGAIFDEAQILAKSQTVMLISRPMGENRIRQVYASVTRGTEGEVKFGEYTNLEDFRIYLLTKFRDTPDRETLLRFIAKVSDERVATSEDNGVAQTVTVRSGVATHAQGVVPSPIQLAPIRTFIEVDQPVGHFLFRLKQVKDALPLAALFELHTNWKRDAAMSVKAYLDAKMEGLGEKRIPVFA